MSEPKRKISGDDAVDMRELYASGDFTVRELAEMYGVAPTTGWKIIKGFSYQALTGGEPVVLPNGKHTFKKKALCGKDHPLHLLNEDEVMAIRRKIVKDGVYGQRMKLYKALAYKYGVSKVTISSIATSHTWKCLPSVKELREGKKSGR